MQSSDSNQTLSLRCQRKKKTMKSSNIMLLQYLIDIFSVIMMLKDAKTYGPDHKARFGVMSYELNGVSNSAHKILLFCPLKSKGKYFLKQSTADPTNIPKEIHKLVSTSQGVTLLLTMFPLRNEIICGYDNCKEKEVYEKTGIPMISSKEWDQLFDKSKIECFNCQKLGHFARECRFDKYQENRANGRQEKRIVAIEDSNSKALVATDNNEDIDWTKEFDAEPVTFAMMELTEVEQDD
ncbi:ribonuclease H-like domain-containing protein [Tanacetum coccineum]